MHIENGTEPTFNSFVWQNNVGECTAKRACTTMFAVQRWNASCCLCPSTSRGVYRDTGQRFPTLAAARANVYVNSCKFINNVCTVARCHTPGIYLTEGARYGCSAQRAPHPVLTVHELACPMLCQQV